MARKLPISPDTSYMLGLYRCNNASSSLRLNTPSKELVARFVKIASMELGTRTESISITSSGSMMDVNISNSRLKKLLDDALEKRDRIFKYKNEYSASYFAGMFDCNGATDRKGVYIRDMDKHDSMLLERIGFLTTSSHGKCYLRKSMDFIMFISPFSVKARAVRMPLGRAAGHAVRRPHV
ncbi:MAG: hypothetical protein ACREBH_04175 [Candidatus Micrarchaeaceae archaeon]